MEQLWETGHLSRVQVAVFRHAWVGRSYGEMAQITGYDAGYLKDTGSKLWRTLSQDSGQRVTKLNFKGVLRRYGEAMVKPYPRQGHEGTVTPGGSRLGAWHYPIDLQVKDGQWADGQGLEELVLHQRKPLVVVGVGNEEDRVALVEQFIQPQRSQFIGVAWKSLRFPPIFPDFALELLWQCGDPHQGICPNPTHDQRQQLLACLQNRRFLWVLDGIEGLTTVAETNQDVALDLDAYQQFFQEVSQTVHQSCILIIKIINFSPTTMGFGFLLQSSVGTFS